MFLVGDITVTMAVEKEYEGRKYFVCQGMAKDGEVYKFSTRFEDHPQKGDVFQMKISPSTRDFKPQASFEKVK